MEKGEVIGKGRAAEVIYWGNNRVLKLFYKDFPNNLIDQQFKIDTIVGEIFPNCPKAFEKIEEKGRIGIVYEYIDGIILSEFMAKKIKNVGKVIKMLAELHVDMHKYEIKDESSHIDNFKRAIHQTDLLDDDQKNDIIKYIEKLPEGNSVCHGDLHPENILVSKDKLYVIDWSNAYLGNPNGDVARTFYLLKYGMAPSDEDYIKKSFIHKFFYKIGKSLVAKSYIKHYIKLTGISQNEIKKWDLAIFATRLHEPVPLEYDNLLKMIINSLKDHK